MDPFPHLNASRQVRRLLCLLSLASVLIRTSPGTETGGEVHIALRTDGRDGIGSVEDPRDGSDAAKLDALWPTLPAGASIVFGEGRFFTRGVVNAGFNAPVGGLQLKDGQRVTGQGEGRTILTLLAGEMSGETRRDLLFTSEEASGNSVQALTLDGNRSAQPSFLEGAALASIYAVNISGRHCRIADVTVVGTFSVGGEGFPICAASNFGTAASPSLLQIERVTMIAHEGEATCLTTLAPGNARATGWIRHCRVIGKTGPEFTKVIAFGCSGALDFEISQNIAEGVVYGLNLDTHSYERLRVTDNYFHIRNDPERQLVGYGLWLGGSAPQTWTDITIRRNTFLLGPNATAVTARESVARLTIEENYVFADEAEQAGSYGRVFVRIASEPGWVEDVRILGNVLDPGIASGEPFLAGVLTWSNGNRTTVGGSLRGLNDDLLAPPPPEPRRATVRLAEGGQTVESGTTGEIWTGETPLVRLGPQAQRPGLAAFLRMLARQHPSNRPSTQER